MTGDPLSRRDVLRSVSVGIVGVGAVASAGSGRAARGRTDAVRRDGRTLAGQSGYEQTTKLTATDGDSRDDFGRSVAVSGDGTTAIVTAPDDADDGSAAGSAYVYRSSSGGWSQQKKLIADVDARDAFGSAVAVSEDGTTALIGASNDEDPAGGGAVFVYAFSGSRWISEAKLAPDDGDSRDFFGTSIALSSDGTTAIIGADNDEDPNGRVTRRGGAGSAYVFASSNGGWEQQTKLAPADGDPWDTFGKSVAVSGDGNTAVIGAQRDEDPNGGWAGTAYVFGLSNGSWARRSKLASGDDDDFFGTSVAVSKDGTVALVGAPGDEDPNGGEAGSAYVFTESGGSWSQQTKLTPDDGDDDDSFGDSVALSNDGTTALLGAPQDEDPSGERAGSVYVFDGSGGNWSQQGKLTPDDGDSRDSFGDATSLSGDGTTALLGAPQDEDPNGDFAGSAYVFDGPSNSGISVPGFSNPARDPDGDGLYEDINGDGQQGLFDALAYYNARNSQTIQSNPGLFDFDGNGTPGTLFDALRLYNEIS